MNIFWKSNIIIIVLFLFSTSGFAGPIEVVYPVSSKKDTRTDYLVAVLKLALEKSGMPYSLKASPEEMTHLRKIRSVAQGKISVVWSAASRETEKTLEPIKIPIYGGLMGYRVFIVHKDTQPALARVKNLASLRTFAMGSGEGWNCNKILRNAGFNLSVAGYESLFKMINCKRIALFPRGVQEAYAEVEARKTTLPWLDIDKYLGLHYINPVFIYVSKSNSRLKHAIKTGLDRAYDNGSFKRFFQNHPFIKTVSKQADMADRRWFELEDPSINREVLNGIQKYYDKVSFTKLNSRLTTAIHEVGELDRDEK